jgi:hypothetical protein
MSPLPTSSTELPSSDVEHPDLRRAARGDGLDEERATVGRDVEAGVVRRRKRESIDATRRAEPCEVANRRIGSGDEHHRAVVGYIEVRGAEQVSAHAGDDRNRLRCQPRFPSIEGRRQHHIGFQPVQATSDDARRAPHDPRRGIGRVEVTDPSDRAVAQSGHDHRSAAREPHRVPIAGTASGKFSTPVESRERCCRTREQSGSNR